MRGTEFWKATGYRVARTFLVTLLSYVTLGGGIDEISWVPALSASALTALLALGTAFINLPEFGEGTYTKFTAVLLRGVRSFAQAFIAFVPTTAVLLSDVDWEAGLKIAAGAAVGSIILGIVSILPEANPNPTPLVQEQK